MKILRGLFSTIAVLALFAPATGWSAIEGSLSEEVPAAPFSRLGLELYSWTYSNPLSNWNGRAATADGSEGDPVEVWNQLTLSTPLFGSLHLEVTPQFVLRLGPSEDSRFRLEDPSVGVEGDLIDSEAFTLWARYEVLLPVAAESRESGMLFAPQASQTLEWRIPNTRLRAELTFIPVLKFYADGTKLGAVYLSPRVYYSISDSLDVFSILESNFESPEGEHFLQLKLVDSVSVGAGVRYQSGQEGFWVQPFLNVYPSGRMASNAHLGVFFGGPLL